MKPSKELFELIKSLTKSEKRFFKLSSSLQSGDKNYLKIFDAIDKQADYEEESIKDQFKDEIFIKHFPSEKNHLYKLILKSLRAYHADNSISSILKQEIKNIEILYKKALFKECNKFLYRAKKMAVAHEKFYYLFELMNWEKLLLEEAYEAGEFTRDIDELIQEEQDIIEKLRNLAAYHVLYSKINFVFRSGGFVRSNEDRAVVEEISNHPLIKGKNTALSNRAATICYYIQGFCAMANRDTALSYQKFMRVKEILDQNELIKNDLPKRYTRTLYNILLNLIDMGKRDEAIALIQDMRNLQENEAFASVDIQVLIFRSIWQAELKLHHRGGTFEEALPLIDEITAGFTLFDGKISKEQELIFNYSIAYTYFGAGQFSKALQWNNKVLNDNEPNLRQDIYSYARLFNLIIHYELGNYDLMEYILKSTMRYLNKRQRDYELEVLILGYIKKISRAHFGSDVKAVFVAFDKELKSRISESSDKVIFEYFDYFAWTRSKIEGVSFAEAIRSKNGHKVV
jgi:hypothetical protein